jgi:hypothetical protein
VGAIAIIGSGCTTAGKPGRTWHILWNAEADLGSAEKPKIIWSDYMRCRAALRAFDLEKIERIIRYSEERYFDTVTRRLIVVGRHDERLALIPYEKREGHFAPVTVHATTRQQINFRLKTGRFIYE